jgi:hypothetical protein
MLSSNLLLGKPYTSRELPPLWVHAHYSSQLVKLWTYVSSLLLSHTPHRSRTGTAGWGTWRMLRCVRERSRSSSPSQLWVAGPLSPYNVIIYLFCTKLLLYSKDVTFDPVPWFIICVSLGPSTPGDYARARVLVPPKPRCDRSGIREMLTLGRNLDRTGQPLSTYLCYSNFFSKLFLIFSHLFPLTLIILTFSF